MDHDLHEFQIKRTTEMVVILRHEIQTMENILVNPPAWLNHPGLHDRTKARLTATKEHLAEYQKDLVIFKTHRKR